MRILLINPNTTAQLTERIHQAAAQVAAPGTNIVPLTAPRGVPYISTRAEAQIGGAIALEMIAENAGGADAAIIAAFGDPGLFGARELFDFPVIGMSEAAMLTACMLGKRFGIVSFAQALEPWYAECVEMHGLTHRLAAIRMLDRPFQSVSNVQDEFEELLVDLAGRTVEENGADVLIFAGAPLAGLAYRVRDRIKVPIVDQAGAAIKQTEALVSLRPKKAEAGTFRRPAAKPNTGLASALAARIAHED